MGWARNRVSRRLGHRLRMFVLVRKGNICGDSYSVARVVSRLVLQCAGESKCSLSIVARVYLARIIRGFSTATPTSDD
jgi:hypothetical protein